MWRMEGDQHVLWAVHNWWTGLTGLEWWTGTVNSYYYSNYFPQTVLSHRSAWYILCLYALATVCTSEMLTSTLGQSREFSKNHSVISEKRRASIVWLVHSSFAVVRGVSRDVSIAALQQCTCSMNREEWLCSANPSVPGDSPQTTTCRPCSRPISACGRSKAGNL